MTQTPDHYPQAELDHSPAEQFIQLESVQQMIIAGVADRIDENGVVKPEKIEKYVQFDAVTGKRWLVGPDRITYYRPGPLMPEDVHFMTTDENGSLWRNDTHKMSTRGMIYSGLIGEQPVVLSEIDLNDLEADAIALEAAIIAKGYTYEFKTEQLSGAYHIDGINRGHGRDFRPVRIYIPAGIDSMLITRQALEAGAKLYGAKVWVPEGHTESQKFRQDTPILEVENFDQLATTVQALKAMRVQKMMPEEGFIPIVGHTVDSLPGVYFGQRKSGASFNGTMEDLFAPAIEAACLSHNLQTGESIHQSTWLAEVAMHARDMARDAAPRLGVDPTNHAFLAGQPVEAILNTIDKAASA